MKRRRETYTEQHRYSERGYVPPNIQVDRQVAPYHSVNNETKNRRRQRSREQGAGGTVDNYPPQIYEQSSVLSSSSATDTLAFTGGLRAWDHLVVDWLYTLTHTQNLTIIFFKMACCLITTLTHSTERLLDVLGPASSSSLG
ncbi:hypothetical protein PoB_002644300 [Plakobranchus ocellatus]|uniref:Uncharacterized protein n=1 Tax=Plakobranchus ocellatus TaxID=259542 RepID=A0AAV3ZZX1_9GAST|nr:hypothetical protein PoB_002644300 [Plakobranchus ocellatus]